MSPDPAPMKLAVLYDPTCTVTSDFLRAARSASIDLKIFTIRTQGREVLFEGYPTWSKLADDLLSFAPDAILSVNRKGAAGDSNMMFLCEVFRIPLLIWYADNPFYLVLMDHEREMESLVSLVFDSAFTDELREWGAREVHHVPLATHPEHFTLPTPVKERERTIPIAFVGTLGVLKIRSILEELAIAMEGAYSGLEASVREAVEEGGRWLESHPLDSPFRFLDEVLPRDHALAPHLAINWSRSLLASLIDYQASFNSRLAAVQRLIPLGIRVWGDESWKLMIPAQHYEGPIAWNKLQRVYQRSRLVLNVSRFQLIASVTQRHFDVPMCGSVLLTDDRPGLRDYYAPGEEILVYRDMDDLEATARKALDEPDRLREISSRARARTLREHTYQHRLGVILKIIFSARTKLSASEPSSLRNPNLRSWLTDRMEALIESGETSLARRAVEVFARVNANDADVLAWRGAVELASGDLAAGRSALVKALEIDPNHAFAKKCRTLMRAQSARA